MVRDASHQQHPDVKRFPAERLAEAAPRLFWSGMGQAPDLTKGTAPKAETIEVYVNEGRWIAECPDCYSAQMAAREDRRFMCHECGNIALAGLWRPVVWPKDVEGIEVALDKRDHRNAHWLPGESVAHLRAENKAHGLD